MLEACQEHKYSLYACLVLHWRMMRVPCSQR